MKKPILYSKGKNGQLTQHEIWTEGNIIYVRHGQVGGKLQTSPGKICYGKNIGKKNETTPAEQAAKQAESMWTHKFERKYALTPEEAQEPLLFPMLAKSFDKIKDKNLRYPMAVQPKLDGLRCLAYRDADGKIILQSRGGKEFNLPRIANFLDAQLPEGLILDGELYIHGVSFQTIGSWIKRMQPETALIEYHTYDCVPYAESQLDDDEDTKGRTPFSGRRILLETWHKTIANLPENPCKLVHSEIAKNRKEVLEFEARSTEQGYEGAIGRHADGTYLFTYRSDDLFKVKTFTDKEFKIIGFGPECKGKFAGTANFICVAENGMEFEVTPTGSMDQKYEYFNNQSEYIGKMLVVKFKDRTDDGIPKIAVGKGIRLEEDM